MGLSIPSDKVRLRLTLTASLALAPSPSPHPNAHLHPHPHPHLHPQPHPHPRQAYGDSGRPPKIGGGDCLVFTIEILKIKGNKSPWPSGPVVEPTSEHPPALRGRDRATPIL